MTLTLRLNAIYADNPTTGMNASRAGNIFPARTINAELFKGDNMEYTITEKEQEILDNNFTYHPPNAEQQAKYPVVRAEAKALAETIHKLCPPSRERSLAITNLEEAVMWANAAIARNE